MLHLQRRSVKAAQEFNKSDDVTNVGYAEVMLQNLHRAHDIVFRKLIFSFGQEFIMLFLDKKDLLKDSWNSKNLCWNTL